MKVGIALACYEPNISFFEAQLESISAQTHKNWICFVVLDSPLEKLKNNKQIVRFFEDPRFHWVENKPKLGAKKNFEKGVRLCLESEVDFIACSDQDDIWHPEKLQVSMETLIKCPPLSLVHCNMRILFSNPDGSTLLSEKTSWEHERTVVTNNKLFHLIVRNCVAGTGMIFSKELAQKYPVIPPNVPYHDHWFAIAAAANGGVFPIEKPLYDYRIHGANLEGLSTYNGFFSLTKKIRSMGLVSKLMFNFSYSKKICKDLCDQGFPITFWQKILFIYRWDFGLGYFLFFLIYLSSDRAFARACLSRAIGKLLKPPFTD